MEEKSKPSQFNWKRALIVYVVVYVGYSIFFPPGLEQIEAALAAGPEARVWLQANQHPGALASNRFDDTADALQFVDTLYSAGAARVVVPPDAIRSEPELGGEYADSLVVDLPGNLLDSLHIVLLCSAEALRQGMSPGTEWFHGAVFLWWD